LVAVLISIKRLSEIRRYTTDAYVEVIKVFYGDADYTSERERVLHRELAANNFRGKRFLDTEAVRQALESCDRQFNGVPIAKHPTATAFRVE
jgi:hypothetical protein